VGLTPNTFPISWCGARSFVQGVFEPFKCTAKKKGAEAAPAPAAPVACGFQGFWGAMTRQCYEI